jgi:hypothetical protein
LTLPPRLPTRRKQLCSLPEILEVLADGALPLGSHPVAAGNSPEKVEVDPNLPAVMQLGDPLGLLEGELLDRMRDRAGEMPKADPGRGLELDHLDGARGVEVDLGVVDGDGEVIAPGQHLDPRVSRGVTQVGLADHLEDQVPWRGDPDLDRAEFVEAPAPSEVEMKASHCEEQEHPGDAADQQGGESADRDPESRRRGQGGHNRREPSTQREAAKIA